MRYVSKRQGLAEHLLKSGIDTVAELAKKASISPRTASRVISGEPVSPKTVRAVVASLGTEVGELFEATA